MSNSAILQEAREIGLSLTEEQRDALRPCAASRRCLLKVGLGKWSSRPGHQHQSIRLTSLGYAVRDALGLTEPKQ